MRAFGTCPNCGGQMELIGIEQGTQCDTCGFKYNAFGNPSSLDYMYYNREHHTDPQLVGPCGLPRHELGISPFTVGLGNMNHICRSDIECCKECPANPNRR